MLAKDIIWSAREDYLDDAIEPYLWKDETLLRHLNTAINEWARDTGSLRDHTTEAICKVPILCNQYNYAMSPLISEIHRGKVVGRYPIIPKDDTWLDENVGLWEEITGTVLYLLPDYDRNYFRTIYYPPSNLGYWSGTFTFTAPGTIAHTIGTGEGNFSTLLAVGSQVVMAGSLLNGTTAIPATFTVASVAAGSFTVVEAIANEALLSGGVMKKVIETMWLTVSRLPLVQLVAADIEQSSVTVPEIRSDDHPYLVHGICKEAYSKQDSQTLDVNKAEDHRKKFEAYKLRGRTQRDWLRASEKTMKPHQGAL